MYTFKNRSYGLFVKNLVLKTYFNDQWRKRCPEQYIMYTYSTVSSGYAVISSMTLQDIIKMKWPNLSEKRSTIASKLTGKNCFYCYVLTVLLKNSYIILALLTARQNHANSFNFILEIN